jgi:hypothetical protein
MPGIQCEICHAPEYKSKPAIYRDQEFDDNTRYTDDEPNREDMRESMSEKNGMTSAMINARIHVLPTIPAQVAHATTVLEWRWGELRKMRKKM